MIIFALLILSLIFLYFSQKILLVHFSRLIHRFGGDRKILIVLWSLIFLPGTIIHELSHFFFAILTGARTGKIEIFPSFLEQGFEDEDDNGGVTLGYVQTQKLNPLQGVLVGLAPFFVGLALLVWISFSIQFSYLNSSYYLLFFQSYLFFTISNSFFPSSSDLRHVLPFSILLILIVLLFWFLGFKLLISPSETVLTMAQTIFITLIASTILNFLIISILFLTNRLFNSKKR